MCGVSEPDRAQPTRTRARRVAAARAARGRRRRRFGALLGCGAAALLVWFAASGGHGGRALTAAGAARAPHAAHGQQVPHGETPVAVSTNAASTATILRYTNYIAAGSTRAREVALTFDDGPGPYTPAILRVLRREHAEATFFEIGRAIRAFPQTARAVFAAGMPIGDHTQTHAFLGRLAPSAQAAEIDGVSNALRATGLPPTTLFRPPYGSFNVATLSALRERRMLMVLWSADTKDFSQPGVKRIVYIAVSGAKPGAIILMHDGGGKRAQTVAALPRIIQRLRQRGFRLVTIPQLLRDDPPPHGQKPPRSLAGN